MKRGKTDWNKPFPVLSITREDLFTAGFPRWQAALSDTEMQLLASLLGQNLAHVFSPTDLETAMDRIIARRVGVTIIAHIRTTEQDGYPT